MTAIEYWQLLKPRHQLVTCVGLGLAFHNKVEIQRQKMIDYSPQSISVHVKRWFDDRFGNHPV